ncbi:MAG: LysR family transcriptional regulator [Streptosporangiales bacterium]|nr:LysR family transcriptional regulator [Streptosporangiales bacterium]
MSKPDDVQLAWLMSFIAVANHGSFTAAARATHRSQPRVSAHVASLEAALGVRLLDRDTRGVEITEAGSRFLPHARAAIAEVRSGMDGVQSLSGQLQGTVVVGSFPGASGVLIAPLIKSFKETHPGVSIELHEGDPGWLEDAVADVNVDIAVRCADTPQRHPHVASEHLFDEQVLVVVPQDDPLATVNPVETAALAGHALAGHALVVTGAPAEGWTDFLERLESAGVRPPRVVTVAQPTTLIALVRAGLGVGLIGEMAATITAFGDVVTQPLADPMWHREIRVYWNSRRQLSTAARTFRESLAAGPQWRQARGLPFRQS